MSRTGPVSGRHGRREAGARATVASTSPRSARRASRALLAGGLAVASATGGVFVAQSASAIVDVVPTFPDNIVVFPDRDFVSVEGYQDHVGDVATVEVTRGGQVIGAAKATVAEGDVAFEINHPGGSCWGWGADGKPAAGLPQVTPDIRKGDKVSVTFADNTGGTTTTGSGVASDAQLGQDGRTVTVTGTLGPDVDRAQIEQRIINPDLVGLVGKRDVRALPGAPVPAPKGGYTSGLDVAADGSYTATYVFDDPKAAEAAAHAPLGERLMSWQEEDADANRQGLTIAEFGEAGGPGFGGCPVGPADSTPAAGSAVVTLGADKKSAHVTWTPTSAAPTASPVVNYSLAAVSGADSSGRQSMVGAQYPATAKQGDITGLDPAATYTFQIRAVTDDGKASQPFKVGSNAGTADPGAAPQLKLTPAPDPAQVVRARTVTASTDAGSTIWYTTQTDPDVPNPVIAGGDLTAAAQQFPAAGLTIDARVTIHVAALNAQGLFETVNGTYEPGTATPPVAPVARATGGQTSATVTWSPVAGETYQVNVYQQGTTTRITPQPTGAQTSPFVVNNLAKGTYTFSVTATNPAGSTESNRVDATVTGVVDTITASTGRYRAGNELRIDGTGTDPTATLSLRLGSPTGQQITLPTGSVTWTAGATPTAPSTYRILARNGQTPNLGTQRVVYVVSSKGGQAGPLTLGN